VIRDGLGGFGSIAPPKFRTSDFDFDWPIKVQRTTAGRNMTATEEALRLARVAAQAAADKLAKDILLVDVSDRLAITDVFVIVTGANERQVGAIVDSIEEKMREAGTRPPRREGERDGRWVLLDFVDVVVHVQHAEERVFYALDRLWKDCPASPFVDASGDPTSVASTPDASGDDEDGPTETGPSINHLLVDSGELDAEVASLEPADAELPEQDQDPRSTGDRPGATTLP
jgi:ribosome-associated protein